MSPFSELGDICPAQLVLATHERLSQSGYALRDVRCECQEGRLVLAGRVSSYYLKQVAQSLVSGLPGIALFVNLIEVHERESRDA